MAEGWALQWISAAPKAPGLPAPDQRVLIASNDDAIVAVFHDGEDSPLNEWTLRAGEAMVDAPTGAGFGASREENLPPGMRRVEPGTRSVNKRLNDRFKNVWPKASESLRAARRRSIFLTGHGLGGAHAMLAALSLCARDAVLNGVYTFGQPRVLARDLALWFNLDFGSHVFRVVNNNDLVTLCPFRNGGYSHAGTLVFFNGAGELHCDPYWWSRLLSDFDESEDRELRMLLEVSPSGVRDHMIERYVELTLRHRDHGLRP
jgi:hypothetical protein